MSNNIGQANYEAYRGTRSAKTSDDMPVLNWSELKEVVREAWIAGAGAAVKAYITEKFGNGDDLFSVASSYGQVTQKGYVEIRFRNEIAQIDPDVARQIARDLLDAAASAETDAFLMTFLMKRTGLDVQRGALVLNEFRKWRKEMV